MAESTLSVGKSEIDIAIADFLGYGRTSGNWDTTEQARIDQARKAGLRDFYNAHDWSFLSPFTSLDTTADQDSDDLEDDFGSLKGSFYFDSDESYAALTIVSAGEIKRLKTASDTSGVPRYAAITPKSQTGASGSRYEVLWYPTPDAAYTLRYQYNVLRNDLTTALPYPAGGMLHADTILACCLAAADRLWNDNVGNWEAKKADEMAKSWKSDGRLRAKNLGYNGDRSDLSGNSLRPLRYNYYNGSIGT